MKQWCWSYALYALLVALAFVSVLYSDMDFEQKVASLFSEGVSVIPVLFTLYWLCEFKRPGLAWGLLGLLVLAGMARAWLVIETAPRIMKQMQQLQNMRS